MYFAATEATEAESLRQFTEALARHTREFIEAPFRDWNDAIAHMFRSFRDRPSIVAIDEFPFLSKTSPALPSIVQRELGPGGSGRTGSARLVLCGSAISFEPLITFYEAIMRNRWAELEIHRAEQVWATTRPTFLSQVVGPQFGALCRAFALESGDTLFAEQPAEVGSGTVNDPANRTQIEIDVVALSAQQPNSPRRILSPGEVKWGELIGHHHLQRLARARDLLRPKGFDTETTVLALYSGAGFTAELTAAAAADNRILLVDLDRLYS